MTKEQRDYCKSHGCNNCERSLNCDIKMKVLKYDQFQVQNLIRKDLEEKGYDVGEFTFKIKEERSNYPYSDAVSRHFDGVIVRVYDKE